ncbi:MAG: HNH endonuclease [Bacteroidales bacterium]|jgi:hypothetical protein|nr:HNH endonuclease [Bacteroidales bacterium]
MEFKFEEYHRNTPDVDLIEDIKTVSRKLQKNTITINEYNENGTFNACTLQRRFKSWFKVLELAGLDPSRSEINISDDDLFKNIGSIWISLGRQPKYDEIKKPFSKYSVGTYGRRFGGFVNALKKFIEYVDNDNKDENKIDNKNYNKKVLFKHKTKREISFRMRFTILMRDGFTCKTCGRSPLKNLNVVLHVDHIIPWSKGGETIPENLETKCEKCNLGKGNEFNV